MHFLVLAVSILLAFVSARADESIRHVDFKNFTYPLSGRTLGHTSLKWLDISAARHIRLTNGTGAERSSGFTLESVTFADVTGAGEDDAIVVLHYSPGGTQQTNYVYIYNTDAEQPKLLAYFHTGDRAYSGFSKVYGDKGKLVVELFDPEKRSGDCCSSGIVRTRYKWHDGNFVVFGPDERETIEEP